VRSGRLVKPVRALREAVHSHPLATFFILSYAFSWWIAPLMGGLILPYGPSLAAVVVLGFAEGRSGLAVLLRRVTKWRVAWRWYAIAVGIVVAYQFGALVLNVSLGATIVETAHLRSVGAVATLLITLLLFGGLWEEPGWTGYALPRLQDRFMARPYGLLVASLVMGALRAGWHLPLVLYGHIPWYDLVLFAVALQFLATWLYNRTQGAVLVVMLLHLSSNVVGGGIMAPLFGGSDATRYFLFFTALAWLIALILVRRDNWSMGHQPHEPRAPQPL
jgi:uncharacterized protein